MKKHHHSLLHSILPLIFVGFLSTFFLHAASGEPDKDPFAIFSQHDDTNGQAVNYDVYKKFFATLSTNSSGRTALYYSAIAPRSAELLSAYTAELSRFDVSILSRQEQLAYWLNLKNLLVVKTIVAERPTRSIETLRGNSNRPGSAWQKKQVTVLGVDLSISDIEQKILLRNFSDPDILYGMYQGSRGGPSLPSEPFEGPVVYEQLRELGETFVNARKALKVRSQTVELPEVYLWYSDALFDGDHSKIIAHLSSLAKPKLKGRLSDAKQLRSKKFSYALDEAQLRLPSYNGPSHGGAGDDYQSDSSYQGGS